VWLHAQVRHWQNNRGEGKLFSFDMLDAHGGEIRATAFNAACDKFSEIVHQVGDAESSLGDAESSLGDAESSLGDAESSLGDAKSSLGDAKSSLGDVHQGRVYRVSKGMLKPKRAQFNQLNSDYEISLEPTSIVEEVADDPSIASQVYSVRALPPPSRSITTRVDLSRTRYCESDTPPMAFRTML
jgi:ssDNA-binding replication factor A large subunit